MNLADDVCYRALTARDARFDGVFFTAVKTTGIYCRPVCTAKTPGRDRCTFYESAALAEQAGYRPCFRCRPELAPGRAPVDQVRTTARLAAAKIEAGALNNGGDLDALASSLGLSARQLRRVVKQELGVTPIELAQTNRLLLAKRLIAETQLPMTQVAFAAGFESVRRFNALFSSRYRTPPGAMRRSGGKSATSDVLRLTLAFRPPFDWEALLRFHAAHATPGVECVHGSTYHRTAQVGEHRGWLSVSRVENRNLLAVELAASLAPALSAILVRLRNLFDLDARPDVVARHLQDDPLLRANVARQPGLRVPGAFDSFELAARTILGQQVSVRGATTIAGRMAARFGEPIETPLPCLTRLSPRAESLARAEVGEIATLGMPGARAEGLRGFAEVVSAGRLDLDTAGDPTSLVARLVELPGIGPWTAEYVAMRAFRWPDAFPAGDLALLKAAQLKSPRQLAKRSESWRPWRAYACLHLWESLRATAETDSNN